MSGLTHISRSILLVLRTPPCGALEAGVRHALAIAHDVIDAARRVERGEEGMSRVGDVKSRTEPWVGDIVAGARAVEEPEP
jgi:hypothetical protein